jgi:hypothetical protein
MSEPQIVINQEATPHSVELASSAKGKVSPTVKVYGSDEMDVARRSLATLEFVRTELRAKGLLAE